MSLSRETLKEFAKDDVGSGLIAFFAVLIVVFSLLGMTTDGDKKGQFSPSATGGAQKVSMFQNSVQSSCAGGVLLERGGLDNSGVLTSLRNFAGKITGSPICKS